VEPLQVELRNYKSAADAEAGYADDLFKKLQTVKQQLAEYEQALESISKNTCCEQCQEARLVANEVLAKHKPEAGNNGS